MAVPHPPTQTSATSTAAGSPRPRGAVSELYQPSSTRASGLLMLLVLVLLAALAVTPFMPAAVVPASGAATAFSAERALPHLQSIARQPRPVGSVGNAQARDYLVAQLTGLGLQPEIQRAVGFRPRDGTAASIENVLVRLPGSVPSRAVLIVAHYDSVLGSPGTGDNALAVAAMVEMLRAVKAGPPLRNDLIVLFDDGEEAGLFGARAFAEQHPWARDVGVAFDFDADSPTGTSVLLWTTPNDGWLVRELARAVPNALTTSSDNSGRRQRNNNDLHALAAAGLTGLHVNTVGGSLIYHSPRDSLAALELGSLQDRGTVMLALTRHFGNLSIGTTTGGDAAFLALYGRTIVHYPLAWALPLALLAGLGATGVTLVGLRRRWLNGRGLGFGLLALLLVALTAVLAAHVGWQAILASHPEARVFAEQDFYGRGVYLDAIYILTAALCLALWPWLDRRIGALHLATGALLWVAALAVFLGSTQPEETPPAILAAFGVMLALPLMAEDGRWAAAARGVGLLLAAVAAIGALFTLLVAASLDGLAAGPALPVALLVLLLGLLAPQIVLVARAGRRWLPLSAALAGLGLLLVAGATSGLDAARPRHESLLYFANPGGGQAIWATLDPAPGSWTRHVLGAGAARRSLREIIGAGGDEQLLSSPAPLADLPAPALVVLGREREGDAWTVRLHLASERGATRIFLVPGAGTRLLAAAVAGQELQPLGSQSLMLSGPPAAGFDLTLRLQAAGNVELVLIDQTAGLPALPGVTLPPRPATTMPLPGPDWAQGDPTLVVRSVTLEP